MIQINSKNYEQIDINNLQLEGDFVDIAINKHLFLHIVRSDCGYVIDCYKYATQEELSKDDYDYDNDFVASMPIFDDDLEKGGDNDDR